MTPTQRHTVHIDPRELLDPLSRRTLEAIDAIWADGKEPDPVLIEEWTEQAPGKVVTDEHQHMLRSRACMIWQIGEIVRVIREAEIDRQVRLHAQRLLGERVYGDKLLADAQTCFNKIGTATQKKASVRLIDGVMEFLTDLERRKSGDLTSITTGWSTLDSFNLLSHGGVLTIAGRPSMGKSALAQALAVSWASHGEKVLVLSTETPLKKAAARYLSAAAGVNSSEFTPDATTATWRAIQSGASQLSELPVWIDDESDRVKTICRSIRRARQQHGVSIVVLDHLQECLDGDDDFKEIGQLLSQIRAVCREAPKTALVIVSQLNRRVESRESKKPRMSDLRASGRIEEVSDSVMLVFRPYYYREHGRAFADADPSELSVFVAKNRDGPTGKITLRWDNDNGRVLGPASNRVEI